MTEPTFTPYSTVASSTADPELYPHDAELEAALLGAVLIDPELRGDVCMIVRPADLWDGRHKAIWNGMLRFDGLPDYASLRADLQQRGELDKAGGAEYLTRLIGDTVFPSHARQYAEQIRELAERRRLLAATAEISRLAYKDGSRAALATMRQTLDDLDLSQPVAEIRGSSWADLDTMLTGLTWAWPGWLPAGYLTVLVGDQEAGKSYLALAIARRYLTGEPWPDGQPFTGKTGAVIWAEAESSQGLNWERANTWHLPKDAFLSPLEDPTADFRLDHEGHKAAFAGLLQRGGVRMAILDSLSGAHGKREADAEMLPLIKWLAELARDTNKPILLTHHLRKRGILDLPDAVTLDRVRGSGTITQTARAVWACDIPDTTKPDARRLGVIKCNLGRKPQPIGFTIDDAGVHFGAAPELPKKETQTDKARDLLLALLDSGPVAANELEQEGHGAGVSWRTMNKAKDELAIVSMRIGGRWVWALPHKE